MQKIIKAIESNGGFCLFIGGYVRDSILGVSSKDIDIEVYNLPANKLIEILKQFGKVSTVGASFGVIKLTTENNEGFDFSLPRRDSKTGKGHKGFMVEVDHTMTPFEAASRRDFTINSMGLKNDELIDPSNGLSDLENRLLRHTSDKFADDPLRVLRGFQFAGRFDLTVVPSTAQLCRSLYSEYNDLAIERVWDEWWKWASKSTVPSSGLDYLVRVGWLSHWVELSNLILCPQDPIWHPEGSVFTHTKEVVNEAAKIAVRENLSVKNRGILVLAGLCHDLGKPEVTQLNENGRWTSPGHNDPKTAESFLESIGAPNDIKKAVMDLVREHMIHVNPVNARVARRLLVRLGDTDFRLLKLLIEADHSGRPPLPKRLPENVQKLAELVEQEKNRVHPIVMGRHLIDMGLKPSPQFGIILKRVFEAQLDGEFGSLESGLEFTTELLGE